MMSQIVLPHIWKPLDDPSFGLMYDFSQSIRSQEINDPGLLPDLRTGSTILVVSDYSGKHDTAFYESLSFLLADIECCTVWEEKRHRLRRRFLTDGRRMAFKNLNDKERKKALPYFLGAADSIPGLSATVLIDKRIESLFSKSGGIDRSQPELEPYAHWRKTSFEKMLRVVHFISFFIAGLSRKNQDIVWVTDEDEIAANEQRLRELTEIWGIVISNYLQHNLRHLRCGTTKLDDGSRQLEDLASIPDLIAGTLTEVFTAQQNEGLMPTRNLLIVPPARGLSSKAMEVISWFANSSQPLKRLVYLIQPIEGSTSLGIGRLQFYNSTGSKR
jgi:hypothetical protein